MSIVKKDIVAKPLREVSGWGEKHLLYTLVKGPSPMLGHFGVRFKVFGRGFDSRSWYGAENFFLHFFGFLVLGSVW